MSIDETNGNSNNNTNDNDTNSTDSTNSMGCGESQPIMLRALTPEGMRALGRCIAGMTRGGDVILLSGPLGAGKTTFAQGFGAGLGIAGPIVSPTFTIAREMDGHFADGSPAHCVHVDAYRLGGERFAPGQNSINALLDELESLGLDEELEDPGERTVVLMEWGEQMVAALAPERLEIRIGRGNGADSNADSGLDDAADSRNFTSSQELSENGERIVTLTPVGERWNNVRLDAECSNTVLSSAGCTLIDGNALLMRAQGAMEGRL